MFSPFSSRQHTAGLTHDSAHIIHESVYIIHDSGHMPLHTSVDAQRYLHALAYMQHHLSVFCTTHAKFNFHGTCQLHPCQSIAPSSCLSTQPSSTTVHMTTMKYLKDHSCHLVVPRPCCAVQSFAVVRRAMLCSYAMRCSYAMVCRLCCAVLCSYAVLCRLCCKAMLCDWDPVGKGKATYALMYAVMSRLGQSPEHLRLPPQDGQLNSAHKGCPGCNRCSGPDWQWKTEAVASLLPYFCECCMLHQLCSVTCTRKEVAFCASSKLNLGMVQTQTFMTQTLLMPSRCGAMCLCAHSNNQNMFWLQCLAMCDCCWTSTIRPSSGKLSLPISTTVKSLCCLEELHSCEMTLVHNTCCALHVSLHWKWYLWLQLQAAQTMGVLEQLQAAQTMCVLEQLQAAHTMCMLEQLQAA